MARLSGTFAFLRINALVVGSSFLRGFYPPFRRFMAMWYPLIFLVFVFSALGDESLSSEVASAVSLIMVAYGEGMVTHA